MVNLGGRGGASKCSKRLRIFLFIFNDKLPKKSSETVSSTQAGTDAHCVLTTDALNKKQIKKKIS